MVSLYLMVLFRGPNLNNGGNMGVMEFIRPVLVALVLFYIGYPIILILGLQSLGVNIGLSWDTYLGAAMVLYVLYGALDQFTKGRG